MTNLNEAVAAIKQREYELEMLCHWASHLVGNKGAFEEACKKWHESFENLITNKSK